MCVWRAVVVRTRKRREAGDVRLCICPASGILLCSRIPRRHRDAEAIRVQDPRDDVILRRWVRVCESEEGDARGLRQTPYCGAMEDPIRVRLVCRAGDPAAPGPDGAFGDDHLACVDWPLRDHT